MKNYLLLFVGCVATPILLVAQSSDYAKQQIRSYLQADVKMNKSVSHLDYEFVIATFDNGAQLGKIKAFQNIEGITINDAIVTLAYDKYGKVFGTNSFTDMSVNATIPKVAKRKAMKLAAKYHNINDIQPATIIRKANQRDEHTVYEAGSFASNPEVRLVYVKDEPANQLILTWQTQLQTSDMQHYYVDYVDAHTGAVLHSEEKVIEVEGYTRVE